MSLPDWLQKLLDPAEQRALDEWAINQRGIPGLELMERAGVGLADLVAGVAPGGRVAVVCGKGNNGGDGYVAARILRDRGREVDVLALAPVSELRGDARTNAERLPGSPPVPFEPAALAAARAIVDAILGTGFEGQPREPAAGAIEAVNDAASAETATVIACDIPSGVNGSTGEVAGAAVRADATATFHAAKPGLWIAPGKSYAGTVSVIDIGIPAGGPVDPSIGLIGDRVTNGVPRRGVDSTKFAAGSVLVCGGSTGLTGAPSLASQSAMRAGAGYVTALVPASLNVIFEQRLLEAMTVPLPDDHGALELRGADVVRQRASRANALVLGPGMGRSSGTFALARRLAGEVEIPLLLDADGLNAHAGKLGSLAGRVAATVLTPHAGELARLLDSDSASIGARRLESARRAAAESQAIVVLKGDDTIVAEPGGRVGVNRGGAPALATAGTGDVLSGVIGAYLSKAMNPFHAACAGVFVHARAGRLAARAQGPEGVIARDVIEMLPHALPDQELAPAMPLRALARVNLAAIERNVAFLRSTLNPGTSLCAVVKGDGYGHGALPTAGAAIAGGATCLAVATALEAAELRSAAVGVPIIVMGAISSEELPVALAAGAEVVAWSERFVDDLAAEATAPVRVHVKLDTGMGRLGTREAREALAVAERVVSADSRLTLAGAMTHFATADDDVDFLTAQLERFAPFAAELRRRPGVMAHAANSAATLRTPESHFDLVRCGIAIYGCDPMNEDPSLRELEPALELTTYVAAVKLARSGESAGYGRTFIAASDTWIATLPIGYADGIRRALSNNGDVLIGGRRYPLAGTVSMDNITVEIGAEPTVKVGEVATIIGDDGGQRQTTEDLARRIATINYEVVCGLSPRVPRVYHHDGELV